jgi:hypothetical protein
MKILIAVNTAWNLYNFRRGLIRAFVVAGYDVVAVAPYDEYVTHLSGLGCRYVEMVMDRKGINPLKDLLLLWRYLELMRKERPDVYIGYTIKPNIYGSVAARVLRIKIINNITGLGAAFIDENWLTKIAGFLYKIALRGSSKVFFQNKDDREMFIKRKIVRPEITDILPGSGVDLSYFSDVSYQKKN